MLLAVALMLSLAAPAWSDNGKGKPGNEGGNNGKNDDDKNNNSNNSGGWKTKKNPKPTEEVQGQYVVRIAGYYTGRGTGSVSGEGVKISATVRDPAGRQYDFQAKGLDVADDRFAGTGSLGGVEVQIDGRLDPRDAKGEVLKKGRITFTFSANGRRARGAGQQSQG